MQSLYLLALDPVAETTADPNSYGFRPERSTADAIEQCFIALAQEGAPQWTLEGDIRACFDGISHDWLLAHAPMEKAMLQKWLKAGFIHEGTLYPTEEGVPQGGIASPVLTNLTLDGLEQELKEAFPEFRKGQRTKVHFVRFADDFIVTGTSREVLEQEVKPLVAAFLNERGLELSPEKTRVTHIEDGFDFLGQNVRKYKGKLLIKPAKKNAKAFLDKVRAIVKANKEAKTGNLIGLLNPVIRGWANFHRHVVSKETFAWVDSQIFKLVWQWAKRRHPKKPLRWIRQKYFRTVGGRNWVLHGPVDREDGGIQELQLFSAASVSIRRHTKIQGRANPYDPECEDYFERRLDVQMEKTLTGRRTLLYLWKEQGGICPVCTQKITKLTGWHSHHRVWRTDGGSDRADNRVLLHPNCHRKVHSQKLDVTKPRHENGVRKA